MNNIFDYNYDDQMCDICEMKRYADECVYYCVECYFVAELKCVLHECLIGNAISARERAP